MRIKTEVFLAIALFILHLQYAFADNSYGFNMDEATKIMQAEHQKQQLRQQYHLKYQQRQAQQQARTSSPARHVQQQNYVPIARQVPRQRQARLPVPSVEHLFDAATNGNVVSIGRLLNQGVSINAANRERETALHMAAARGQYSAVIYLINHGADVNARTIKNWTPLHHAVRFRHANIANYLRQRGAPLYVKTSDGMSAIDMAKAAKDQRMLNILGGGR